ncbi:MAG: hypothetical protein RL317_1721, partial [Pseudomonadota bacterium]
MFDSLTLSVIPQEDEALRMPVRAMIAGAIRNRPLDQRARSWQGFDADFSRVLGAA